ncbi:MAG: T9SS type A sorting domain-containing protein [Candidatus Stahlbacteria bacterium]|nr:T9SS type A sorting domain-containing protein [Candidatus Stahlbacteria bacterium]
MDKKSLVLIALFVGTVVSAQSILWTGSYGGSYYDIGCSVDQCSDSGFVIAGYVQYSWMDTTDVYLVRTKSNGDTLWTRLYSTRNRYEYIYSVQECSDGGFIMSGNMGDHNGNSFYIPNLYLIRTNSSGNILWERTYGGTWWENGYSVQECLGGGFIVTGYIFSSSTNSYDVWLLRVNANGNEMWNRTYGGNGWEAGHSVAQCSDGGFIVTGVTGSFGAGRYDIYLIRTNTNGDTSWTRTYGTSEDDEGYSAAQCSDDSLWTKMYGGGGDDVGYSVKECTDGKFIITGDTRSFGAGWSDVYLIYTDTEGNKVWTETYGYGGNDAGKSVQECAEGGFIVGGYTSPSIDSTCNFWLLRVGKDIAIEERRDAVIKDRLTVSGLSMSSSVIKYSVPSFCEISLRVYDLMGREVAVIADGRHNKGSYSVNWDSRSVSAGVYFVILNSDGYKESKKIVIIK